MTKKHNTILIIIIIVLLLSMTTTTFISCNNKYISAGNNYDVYQLDLSNKPSNLEDQYNYLYEFTTIDNDSDYMAHPDSILINNKITTMYVNGHGKGEILVKSSSDGGLTYSERLTTPSSWKTSEETPTLFTLNFINGSTKYLMISANPKWANYKTGDGFNVSVSNDGDNWTEFEKFYGVDNKECSLSPIVAMSSLVQLKENGSFVDKWMGIFHDENFKNYKTILSFDIQGHMIWSKPVEYFKGAEKNYFDIAKGTQMCEVMLIRSNNGIGDELCLITRSNSKTINSLISFSQDEGETWSQPKEIFAALNGERLKANYTNDGRLVITFRSIERDPNKLKTNYNGDRSWYSEGWIMWVGNYSDLSNWYNGTSTKQGDYRIKIAHTYLDNQQSCELSANADTGYCGNVILDDGFIVTSSYGCFSNTEFNSAGEYKTYIASKRINLEDTDYLVNLLK